MDRNHISKGKYNLGLHNGGACYLTWELYRNAKGVICFSMQGERWEVTSERQRGRERDTTHAGQCCDTIAAWFPDDKKAARMVEVWKRWHLNDIRAGSPKQEIFIAGLKANPEFHYQYEKVCELLRVAGLYNDAGYVYGSAWVVEELPEPIIEEIKLW